jgi:hypothetical protein
MKKPIILKRAAKKLISTLHFTYKMEVLQHVNKI